MTLAIWQLIAFGLVWAGVGAGLGYSAGKPSAPSKGIKGRAVYPTAGEVGVQVDLGL